MPRGTPPWLIPSVLALPAFVAFFLLQFLDVFHSRYLRRAVFLGNEC